MLVTSEKITTAQSPAFIARPALCFPIEELRLISINTGIATAGKIRAWNAWEPTINKGGAVSINCIPNPNKTPIKPRVRYMGDFIFRSMPL